MLNPQPEKPLIIHYNGQPFVLFYGHTEGKQARCFSNFYPVEFDVDINEVRGQYDLGEYNRKVTLHSTEQYLMLRKALLFGDITSAVKILKSPSPASAKALGRKVENFDEVVWVGARSQIMVDGLMLKFAVEPLRSLLLDTGEATLVECSPTDKIWGVGLKIGTLEAFQRDKWQGLNLLGDALMETRRRLRM